MTDDLVPVPIRVRYVAVGDELVSAQDDSRWRVTDVGENLWRLAGRRLTAVSGKQTITSELDPDRTLDVLVPADEYAAVELLHAELGARLTGQRTV
jgi:hypothetical protein